MGLSWCKSKRTNQQRIRTVAEREMAVKGLKKRLDELSGQIATIASVSQEDVSLPVKMLRSEREILQAMYDKECQELLEATATS